MPSTFDPIAAPVSAFQRLILPSAPPVRSVAPSGRNATDQTGAPSPASVRITLRALRSTIATVPSIAPVAIKAPSCEIARATIGLAPAMTSPFSLPSAVIMRSFPSAAPVTISPSGEMATAFSGAGITTISALPPAKGQIRTVRS
ncbi:hypothetical protein ACVME8_007681 [Bradyrhizobium diazoefficiens]